MKWFTNLKIKSKLILGFLVLSIIAALIGGFGMLTIVQIKASADRMYSENAKALQYAGSAAMKTQAVVTTTQTMAGLDTKFDKDAVKTYTLIVPRDITEVDAVLQSLDGVLNSDIKKSAFEAVTSNWSTLKTYLTGAVDNILQEDGAAMAANAIRLSTNVANSLTSGYSTLLDQVSGEASKRAAENNSQAATAMIIMGSVVVIAIVLSILLGFSLAKSIGNPLKLMAAAGMRIAEGDVNVGDIMTDKDRKLADRKDEIGTLATMVNRLITGTEEQAQEAQRVGRGRPDGRDRPEI